MCIGVCVRTNNGKICLVLRYKKRIYGAAAHWLKINVNQIKSIVGLQLSDWPFAKTCDEWHTQTDTQTDIATYRNNQPRNWFGEN